MKKIWSLLIRHLWVINVLHFIQILGDLTLLHRLMVAESSLAESSWVLQEYIFSLLRFYLLGTSKANNWVVPFVSDLLTNGLSYKSPLLCVLPRFFTFSVLLFASILYKKESIIILLSEEQKGAKEFLWLLKV